MTKRDNNRTKYGRPKNAEKEDEVVDLVVLKTMNDSFADDVDYRKFSLIKLSAGFKEGMAHELIRMTRNVAAQMRKKFWRKRSNFDQSRFKRL